mgnify:CR=1 FL=1
MRTSLWREMKHVFIALLLVWITRKYMLRLYIEKKANIVLVLTRNTVPSLLNQIDSYLKEAIRIGFKLSPATSH